LKPSRSQSYIGTKDSHMNKGSVLTLANPLVRRPRVRVSLRIALVAMSVWCGAEVSVWAQDQENLGNFANVAEAQPAPQERLSLPTVAPGLLTYFNNGPVFGLAGTVEGNFWRRTQLTGGWNNTRTDWTERGVFLDFYTTSAYQNVMSGGL